MLGTMAETDGFYQVDLPQRLQIAIGPFLLILVLYYTFSYLTYETTIKRSLYETTVSLFPEKIRRTLQQSIFRLSGLLPERGGEHEGTQNKSGILQTAHSAQGISSVVQRARSLSGFDKLVAPTSEITFSGLGNWDNSCFQNSVLQGLASLSTFRQSVETGWRASVAVGVDAPALEGVHTFISELQQENHGRRTLWPPSVLRSMNTWQQQDAQEYLSKILDSIEKETTKTQKVIIKRSAAGLSCLRKEANITRGPMDGHDHSRRTEDEHRTTWLPPSSLEGYLSQKLRCQRCGFSEGLTFTSFNCLTLNLGMSGSSYLDTLLDTYFEPEMIDGVECDECTRLANESSIPDNVQDLDTEQKNDAVTTAAPVKVPKVLSTKTKHILFGRLPQNLAFHINRSIFDDWGNQRKNHSFVEFPAQLKVWSDWVEELGSDDTEVHAFYELRCIINHSGRHDNGHYVTCGKRGKEWFLFNDEIVTKTTEADVLTRGNVFMLFYEKLDIDPIMRVSTPKSSDTSPAESPSLYGDAASEPPVVPQMSSDVPDSAIIQ